MARDATARLYDVDEDTCVLHVRNIKNRYDQGVVEFHARQGKGVELEKLHESIWATRLSRGTRSGAVCLQITALGSVVQEGDELVLKVNESEQVFALVDDVAAKPPELKESTLPALRRVLKGRTVVGVTGYVDGWRGNWPGLLRQSLAKRPRLMVVEFQTSGDKAE